MLEHTDFASDIEVMRTRANTGFDHGFKASGSITPAKLMGKDFISQLPESGKIEVFGIDGAV